MKKIMVSTLVMIALTVSSCGGGGSEASHEGDTVETPVVPNKPTPEAPFVYDANATIGYPKGLKTKTYLLQLESAFVAENAVAIPQIQRAIDTWNTAIGHTVLSFDSTNLLSANDRFAEASVDNQGHISLNFKFGGLFTIFSGWTTLTPNLNTVASTYRYASSKGEITSSVIRLNRQYFKFGDGVNDTQYTLDTDNVVKLTIDVEAVILHELGHVLGLNHSTQTDSVMTAITTYNDRNEVAQKRILSQCDINRVQSIYSNVTLLDNCK